MLPHKSVSGEEENPYTYYRFLTALVENQVLKRSVLAILQSFAIKPGDLNKQICLITERIYKVELVHLQHIGNSLGR